MSCKRYIELLAPARTADIGIEAIRHGADAVYIGGPAFGARQAACNSVEDIARLVEYARPFRVRIYVTINTLLHPDERPTVQKLIWQLYDIGVSALIIQDTCILDMHLPPIPLHASTQMDNRTPERVAELHAAGFEQVVLARELDTAQIAAIHEAVPDMPLEVFVHGALCVGLSGRCYASEHLYGRSANRGECAQVCRLKYNLVNERGETLVRDRYLLSLKDMNRSRHIEELMEAGATSFKIEGRLKDMAYVKNITAYYRQLIDSIIRRHPDRYARASLGRETYTFTPDPSRSFNRGFTPYLSTDSIFQPLTPKAIGEHVGRVQSIGRDCITVEDDHEHAAEHSLSSGDGLCYFAESGLQGFRVNRAEGNRLYPRPMPRDLAVGTPLYRNQDQAMDKLLAANSAERTIPINIYISDTPTGFLLTAELADCDSADTQDSHPYKAELAVEYKHEAARTDQRGNIIRQLSKLGDTPYRAASVSVQMSDNWFVPSSLLAAWRRELIQFHGMELNSHPMGNISHGMGHKFHAVGMTVQPRDEGATLMYCRHCLRRELGACLQGKQPEHRVLAPLRPIAPTDTLYLTLPDGNRLRLGFDCNQCQMIIYAT